MKLPSSSATNLNKKAMLHLITLQEFSVKEVENLLKLMTLLKNARRDGAVPQLFKNRSIAMIFEAGSLRTRVSFEVAATLLGGHALFLSPKDIHLGAKERIEDTSRVLARMCDLIMARTNKGEIIDALVKTSTVPVINGLDTRYHPTQILADFFTIKEHFSNEWSEITLAFMGDATDVCRSLLLACTKIGINFKQIGPKKYHMEEKWLQQARENCLASGASLEVTDDLSKVSECNVIYGDSFYWTTQLTEKEERLALMMPNYVISKDLLSKAKPGALFLHCLPANDQEEATRGALESDQSVIFDQSENRLTAQMAIIVYFTHQFIEQPSKEKLIFHKQEVNNFLENL